LEISTATLFLFKKTHLSSEKFPEGRECRRGNISIENFFPYAQYELYFAPFIAEKVRTYRQNLTVVFTLKTTFAFPLTPCLNKNITLNMHLWRDYCLPEELLGVPEIIEKFISTD
jgi:hypothetical protein